MAESKRPPPPPSSTPAASAVASAVASVTASDVAVSDAPASIVAASDAPSDAAVPSPILPTKDDTEETPIDIIRAVVSKPPPLTHIKAEVVKLRKYLKADFTCRDKIKRDEGLAAWLQNRRDASQFFDQPNITEARKQEIRSKLKEIDEKVLWYCKVREEEKGFSNQLSKQLKEIQSCTPSEVRAAIQNEIGEAESYIAELERRMGAEAADASYGNLMVQIQGKIKVLVNEGQLLSQLNSVLGTVEEKEEAPGVNKEAVEKRLRRQNVIILELGRVEAEIEKRVQIREPLDQAFCENLLVLLEKAEKLREEYEKLELELKGLRQKLPVAVVELDSEIARLQAYIDDRAKYGCVNEQSLLEKSEKRRQQLMDELLPKENDDVLPPKEKDAEKESTSSSEALLSQFSEMAADSLQEEAKKFGWFEEGMNVERRARQKVIAESIESTDEDLTVHCHERQPLAEKASRLHAELLKKGCAPADLEEVKGREPVPANLDEKVTEWIYVNREIKAIDGLIIAACEDRVEWKDEEDRIIGEALEFCESSPLTVEKVLARVENVKEELLCLNKHIAKLDQKVKSAADELMEVGGEERMVISETGLQLGLQLGRLVEKRKELEDDLSTLVDTELYYLQNPASEEDEEPVSPSRQGKLDRFADVGDEIYENLKEIQRITSTIAAATKGQLADSLVDEMTALLDKRRSLKVEADTLRGC